MSDVEDGPSDDGWLVQVRGCLGRIHSHGRIAAFNKYCNYANPGIEINGVTVGLPLTQAGIDTITAANRRKLAGWNDEGLRNRPRGQVCELQHPQFALTNPSWDLFLEKIVADACKILGAENATAKPNKLRLYEQGSFARPSTLSSLGRHVLGRLAICLPSAHEGADMHVTFGDEKLVFRTAPTSAFDMTCLAWLANTTHEVKEIVSGHRLVITYNLFLTGIMTRRTNTPAELFANSEQLQRLLQSWQHKRPETVRLVYRLDNQYLGTNLFLKKMIGKDHAICSLLSELGSKAGLYLFFARLIHSAKVDENDQGTTVLETVYTTDGKGILSDILIPTYDGSIINERLRYDQENPDAQDQVDVTGTNGQTWMARTNHYYDAAVIIVPNWCLDRFLQSAGFCWNYMHPPTFHVLIMVHEYLQKASKSDQLTRSCAQLFMEKLLQSQDAAICEPAAVAIFGKWALEFSDEKLGKIFHTQYMNSDCKEELQIVLATHIRKAAGANPEPDWNTSLGCLVKGVTAAQFQKTFRAIPFSSLPAGVCESLRQWAKTIIKDKITTHEKWKITELEFLYGVIRERSEEIDWILEDLIPNVIKKTTRGFLIRLLSAISLSRTDKIFVNKSQLMYKCVLKCGLPLLALRHGDLRPSSGWGNGWPSSDTDLRKFVQVLTAGYLNGAGEETETLLETSCFNLVKSQSSWLQIVAHLPLVQDFLGPLAQMLQTNNVRHIPSVTAFFVICLRKLARSSLGFRGMALNPARCSGSLKNFFCRDCQQRNAFLASETETSWQFRAQPHIRNHLLTGLSTENLKIEEIQTRVPYTLLITKVFTDEERSLRHWRSANDFAPLKTEYVRRLLGEGSYQTLIERSGKAAVEPIRPPSPKHDVALGKRPRTDDCDCDRCIRGLSCLYVQR